MSTFAERGISRNNLLRRVNIHPTPRMVSRTTMLTRSRPGINIASRPGINNLTSTMSASAPSSLQRSIQPVAGAGGLPGAGLTGGVTSTLSTALGGIGGDISSTFGGITDQVKSFIPIAVKIIGVVLILKIVLWLVKGRR